MVSGSLSFLYSPNVSVYVRCANWISNQRIHHSHEFGFVWLLLLWLLLYSRALSFVFITDQCKWRMTNLVGKLNIVLFLFMSVDVKFNKIFVYIFEVFISSIFLPLFFFCFIGNVGFFYHFMLSFGRFELARYFSIKKKLENKNWNQFHFSESAQIKALLNVEMENPIQWYLLTKRGGPIYIHLFYTVCVFFPLFLSQ